MCFWWGVDLSGVFQFWGVFQGRSYWLQFEGGGVSGGRQLWFEGEQFGVVVGDWFVDFVATPPIFLCHSGPEGHQSVRVQSRRGAATAQGGGGGHVRPDREFTQSYPPVL